jgi:hypothetical protein
VRKKSACRVVCWIEYAKSPLQLVLLLRCGEMSRRRFPDARSKKRNVAMLCRRAAQPCFVYFRGGLKQAENKRGPRLINAVPETTQKRERQKKKKRYKGNIFFVGSFGRIFFASRKRGGPTETYDILLPFLGVKGRGSSRRGRHRDGCRWCSWYRWKPGV